MSHFPTGLHLRFRLALFSFEGMSNWKPLLIIHFFFFFLFFAHLQNTLLASQVGGGGWLSAVGVKTCPYTLRVGGWNCRVAKRWFQSDFGEKTEAGLGLRQGLGDLALQPLLLLGARPSAAQLSRGCHSPAQGPLPHFHRVAQLCIWSRKCLVMWVLMKILMTFGRSSDRSPVPLASKVGIFVVRVGAGPGVRSSPTHSVPIQVASLE